MSAGVVRTLSFETSTTRAGDVVECDVKSLSIAYRVEGTWLRAVRDLSFQVRRGQMLAIVGETGSGKSSTGSALLRLLPSRGKVVGGSIEIAGQDVLALSGRALRQMRGKLVGYVPQQPSSAFNPTMTIGRQVAEALVAQGARYRETIGLVCETLAEMGLDEPERLVNAYPHQLSGGMLQRAMIAGAIIGRPRLLIADEPTSALDVSIQRQILDLLRRVRNKHGLTAILITHDLGAVAQIADIVMVLYGGRLVEIGPMESVLNSPRHPYTRGLIESTLGRGQPHKSRLAALPGTPPSPGEIESDPGCPFRSRCIRAISACREQFPNARSESVHVWHCHNPGSSL
ncbi:MAG: ABC transporter ATP-binding protein [Actinomycetota bacterium]|jgi:oligopeptide/dipeptide ABC transporter ATP-binding protein|nr:ABC transporter ATP-binding protein [Actinomycetota bacterium]